MSNILSAFGFKMKAAGVDTDGAQLHIAAIEALKAHSNSPHAACQDFMAAVIAGGGIGGALIKWGDDGDGYDLCLVYLRMVALDMTGNRKPGAGIPPQQNEDGAGLSKIAEQANAQVPASSSPNRQIGPSAGQLAAAKAVRQEAAKTIYDTFKARDGRAWGNVGAHELLAYDSDGAVARIFLKVVGPKVEHGKPSDKVKPMRELLTEEEFRTVMAKAKRLQKKTI